MKAIATLRYYVQENVEITPETLTELGFEEVLQGRFKLEEQVPDRCDAYKTTIYIDIIPPENEFPQVVLIEARNIYGSVKHGNNILVHSSTYKDLLTAIEMIHA